MGNSPRVTEDLDKPNHLSVVKHNGQVSSGGVFFLLEKMLGKFSHRGLYALVPSKPKLLFAFQER